MVSLSKIYNNVKKIPGMVGDLDDIINFVKNISWADITSLASDTASIISTVSTVVGHTANIAWGDITSIAADLGDVASDVSDVVSDVSVIAWDDITTIASDAADIAVEIPGMVIDLTAIVADVSVIAWGDITSIATDVGTALVDLGTIIANIDITIADIASLASDVTAFIVDFNSKLGDFSWDVITTIASTIVSIYDALSNLSFDFGEFDEFDFTLDPPSVTEGTLGDKILTKVNEFLVTIDDVITVPEISMEFSEPWNFIALGLNFLWNEIIGKGFEFIHDQYLGIVKWQLKVFAWLFEITEDALGEWWNDFLDKYFFVAFSVSLDGVLSVVQSIFDTVEGDYETPFSKFKIGINMPDVPNTPLFNFYLPNFLKHVVFDDDTQTWFGQDQVEAWHLIVEVLGLVLIGFLAYFTGKNATTLMKKIFKMRTKNRKKVKTVIIRRDLGARWRQYRDHFRIEEIYSRKRYPMG